MTERYTLVELHNGDGEITHKVIHKDGESISNEKAVVELNDLEKIRKRKGREIEKFRARESKYQRVIGGLKAYLELELNSELWWDWND